MSGGCEASHNPESEGTVFTRSSLSLEAVAVTFDDGRLVAPPHRHRHLVPPLPAHHGRLTDSARRFPLIYLDAGGM